MGAEFCCLHSTLVILLVERSSENSFVTHKENRRHFENYRSLRVGAGKEKECIGGVQGKKSRSKTYMKSTWRFCNRFLETTFNF